MNEVKSPAKNRTAGLVKVLYAIAAVIAVIFVYMVIVNIAYMQSYLEAYGMTFSDMWMDTVQYVITGSISYLVYAILVFCAGKIINMLSIKDEADADENEVAAIVEDEEDIAEEAAEEVLEEDASEEAVEENVSEEEVAEEIAEERAPEEEVEPEKAPSEEEVTEEIADEAEEVLEEDAEEQDSEEENK